MRWLVAVLAALAGFGGCWLGLAAERVMDTGTQVGVASVPLVVVLTVLGAWAERARERKAPERDAPEGRVSAWVEGSPRGQAIGQMGDGGLVIGPGASLPNAVFNLGGKKEPLRGEAGGPAGVLVVGDVPQEPVAFQPRAGPMGVLEREAGPRVSVVFAVTGIRGVGKTQVAAAYARRRIADGWRLVAWVDAGDAVSVLAGLARVAVAAGLGPADEDARVLAAGVRHWLEADGARRLVVFDNAADLDGLRPYLPAGGAGQVVITSNRRAAAGLGTGVPVDMFTQEEALAFLAERTGLADVAGARELAGELGFLPLGLAQAAAVIAREHLGYGTYLGRLRALPVAQYLARVEGDAYPYRLAEAIVLSLRGVEDTDRSGRYAEVMGLLSVLAETGVSRRLLHAAGEVPGADGAAEMDAVAGRLADASLVGFSLDDSVAAHRLVMRVVRERLIADGRLPAVAAVAVKVLGWLADEIAEAWQDPAGVRELAAQVSALTAHSTGHLGVPGGEVIASLLLLRLRSAYLLNTLGDSTGQAILAAGLLVADCEQTLGADHPDTQSSRNNLAYAYRAAGRTAEAIPLYEQTLADRERVLGADHPDTLSSRNNLACAYDAAGRTAEAIPLHEQTFVDRERVLGADHPDTLSSRNNLACAYDAAGRTTEAIPLHLLTLADCERVLGADHPDTLTSRTNLACAYDAAGRTAEALPLHEQALVDCERVLGADHPDTLTSRTNLAYAYDAAGRTAEAIPLYEQTLADCERVLGADHPQTSVVKDSLAAALRLSAADREGS